MTLPREDPATPIVPGARWRSRGTSGHQFTEYTVLKFNGRSVFVVHEGASGQHKSGKRYAIPEAAFRNNHVLLKQPPGWTPESAVVDALADIATRPDDLITRLTSTRPEYLYNRSTLASDPVPSEQIPEVIEAITPLRDAFLDPAESEEEPSAMQPTPSVPHATPAEPVANPVIPPDFAFPEPEPDAPEPAPAVAPEITETTAVAFVPAVLAEGILSPPEGEETEETGEGDPIEEFLRGGLKLSGRLQAEMARLATRRDDLLTQAEEVDGRYQAKRAQFERIEAVIAGARAAAGIAPDPSPSGGETVVASRGQGPKPQAEGTQRAWVLNRLKEQRTLIVSDVAAQFGRDFNLDLESSRKNIASIMVDQMKRPVAPWPQVIRVSKGTYAAQYGT